MKQASFNEFLLFNTGTSTSYHAHSRGRSIIVLQGCQLSCLRLFGSILLLLPSVLSQFCVTVPKPAKLSYLHSLFNSERKVILCPDFEITGDGCDTNENPFIVSKSDLTVECEDFNGGGGLCKISCPGIHFRINSGKTLVLERLNLEGATNGSIVMNAGSSLIAFDSSWKGNNNLKGNGKGGAVYSAGSSIVYLVYSKFLGNTAQSDGGALYIKGSLSIIGSTLKDNETLNGKGGALFAVKQSSVLIRLSFFDGNKAVKLGQSGPAIFLERQAIIRAEGNYGCGNMADSRECNGYFINSTGSCADFESTCNTTSKAPSSSPSMHSTSTTTNILKYEPTMSPTYHQTKRFSSIPSANPTTMPSTIPSTSPSDMPSTLPSISPTPAPSITPTTRPTDIPSAHPSNIPTSMPSNDPSEGPTVIPSTFPTIQPTATPSILPTVIPTSIPSVLPSTYPTGVPSIIPSDSPSGAPSSIPSTNPTYLLSYTPSTFLSNSPSKAFVAIPCYKMNGDLKGCAEARCIYDKSSEMCVPCSHLKVERKCMKMATCRWRKMNNRCRRK